MQYNWRLFTENNFLVILLNEQEHFRLDKSSEVYESMKDRAMRDVVKIGGEIDDQEGILNSSAE